MRISDDIMVDIMNSLSRSDHSWIACNVYGLTPLNESGEHHRLYRRTAVRMMRESGNISIDDDNLEDTVYRVFQVIRHHLDVAADRGLLERRNVPNAPLDPEWADRDTSGGITCIYRITAAGHKWIDGNNKQAYQRMKAEAFAAMDEPAADARPG